MLGFPTLLKNWYRNIEKFLSIIMKPIFSCVAFEKSIIFNTMNAQNLTIIKCQ